MATTHIVRMGETGNNFALAFTRTPGTTALLAAEAPQATRTADHKISVTTGPASQLTLDAYDQAFGRLFVAYNGPDEPPGFEPEEHPVR